MKPPKQNEKVLVEGNSHKIAALSNSESSEGLKSNFLPNSILGRIGSGTLFDRYKLPFYCYFIDWRILCVFIGNFIFGKILLMKSKAHASYIVHVQPWKSAILKVDQMGNLLDIWSKSKILCTFVKRLCGRIFWHKSPKYPDGTHKQLSYWLSTVYSSIKILSSI